MPAKQIIVSNLKINYYVSENFDPENGVVFLHGWNSPAILFLRAMGKMDNLLAINLPGFGGSDRPKDTWGVSEYASFIYAFISKLNMRNPVISGHSFGGAIAVKYASLHENYKKLILICPAIVRKKTFKILFYCAASKLLRAIFPSWIKTYREKFYKKINSTDYLEAGAMLDIYKKIIRQDLSQELAMIKKQITIIWGVNDIDAPLASVKPLVEKQNNITLHVISNSGHYCFLDNNERFKEIFFKSI